MNKRDIKTCDAAWSYCRKKKAAILLCCIKQPPCQNRIIDLCFYIFLFSVYICFSGIFFPQTNSLIPTRLLFYIVCYFCSIFSWKPTYTCTWTINIDLKQSGLIHTSPLIYTHGPTMYNKPRLVQPTIFNSLVQCVISRRNSL